MWKIKTIKLLKESVRENLQYFGIRKDFFKQQTKSGHHTGKKEYIKIKTFYSLRDTMKRIRR